MSASIAVDVSPQALREGFRSPVVVMCSAYEATVEAPDEAEETAALTCLLRSAYLAAQSAIASSDDCPDRLGFTVPLAKQRAPLTLSLLLSEPILVITLPDPDDV